MSSVSKPKRIAPKIGMFGLKLKMASETGIEMVFFLLVTG